MSGRVVINKRGYPVAVNWSRAKAPVGGRERRGHFLEVRDITAGGVLIRDNSGRSRATAGGLLPI